MELDFLFMQDNVVLGCVLGVFFCTGEHITFAYIPSALLCSVFAFVTHTFPPAICGVLTIRGGKRPCATFHPFAEPLPL